MTINTNTAPQLFHHTGGKLLTPVGSGKDPARSIALQADGTILVAGKSIGGVANDDLTRWDFGGWSIRTS